MFSQQQRRNTVEYAFLLRGATAPFQIRTLCLAIAYATKPQNVTQR